MHFPITISLIVGIATCRADSELLSPASLRLRSPHWVSPAFRYECVQDCHKESRLHSGRRVADPTASAAKDSSCEVSCGPNTIKQTSWAHQSLKSVFLTDPKQPGAPKTACMILVAKEDISCSLLPMRSSRPSTRDSLVISGNSCRRINYRYYLGKSCDNEERNGVGEETCREACSVGVSATPPHLADTNRTRAIFRPCYRGLLLRGEHAVDYDICSVELKPCSKCFKWGNWTLASPCSRTCGSPGVKTYIRRCYIMDRSDIIQDSPSYSSIESHFCKAYLGGTDSRTEKCGMRTKCPQWTTWESWTQCNAQHSKAPTARKKCKTRKHKTKDIKIAVQEIPRKNISHTTAPPREKLEVISDKSDATNIEMSTRRRVCLPRMHGCPGNSLQKRLCSEQHRNEYNYTTDNPGDKECDDEETDESTIEGISTTRQMSAGLLTKSSNETLPDATVLSTTVATSINHKKSKKKNNNRNFTVENEGGFTSVINNYAAVLITCLLVFIVLLLFALITICWKIMKRSRPNRYQAPPPSFSAGTLGSIPAVLGHGYPPPLGLRRGSGTFGRSEYPPNLSDAYSSKGSWRSSSSNVTNKSRSRNKRPPLFATGVVLNAGSIRQQATFSKASVSELPKSQQPGNEPNMGSKKPSTSSLLSSASSAAGTSVSISTCPFQPLPPIPPDMPPSGPLSNGKSYKKRDASRSSSNNPDDCSRKSTIVSQDQSKFGSFRGRPIEMSHFHDERSHTSSRHARQSFSRRLQSVENQHVQLPRRGTNESHNISENGETPTENEYWSVSREEDSLLPDSPIPPPLGEIKRQHKPLMRVCGHRETESSNRRRLRSYQSSDSAEFDSTELVDNVLYDEQKEKLDSHPNVPYDDVEQSEHGSDSCGDDNIDGGTAVEPLYNSIRPSASSAKGVSSDSSAENDDEYDHLYKDSSTPNSPKGPHTMRVMTHAMTGSCRGHNYESIDINNK